MHKESCVIAIVILIGFVGLSLVPPVFAEGKYSFLGTWGTLGSGLGQFSYPHGIAVDTSGNVYVGDSLNNRIQKFDQGGTFISAWGTLGSGYGQFNWPGDVALDNLGNIYVAENLNYRIQKFSPNGSFITAWGSYGTGYGQFGDMDTVAVDKSGYVYVSDSGNNRVQKFSLSGSFITAWGSYGTGYGQFDYQEGLAVDDAGNVYVADANNNRIQKFDHDGTFITMWGTFGSGNGQFDYPHQIATDNAGNVYISEWGNYRIQKFGPNGAFITKWGTSGSGVGQFYKPASIAISSSRDVYVADAGNNRIQVFSPDRFTDTLLDYWATPYIEVIYQAGFSSGYGSATIFAPEFSVTREQMAAFIVRAKEGEPASDYCSTGSPFPDCTTDSWSCRYVKRLYELGLTTGYGTTGLYMPSYEVTREQMAAFLIRAIEGEPLSTYCDSGSPFSDVSTSRWSCIYIKRLYELGITTGYGNGLYGPNDLVTRAQMAVFLGRAFLGMD